MECDLWKMIVAEVRKIKARHDGRWTFAVSDVVLTYFWSVLQNKPVSWACDRRNWPLSAWRRPLPTPSTMSRRLRTAEVSEMIAAIEQNVLLQPGATWVHAVDGKALPVSRHSTDPDARFGRGAGGQDKGYKLHVLYGQNGSIAAHAVEPLNVDERIVARRLIEHAKVSGYVVADAYYDDNKLHAVVDAEDGRLVTPRRYSTAKGVGHHPHSPARLRALARMKSPNTAYIEAVLGSRGGVERYFGTLACAYYGLDRLPPWVRTLPRVRRWVQAKIILDRLAAIRRRRAG
jgi:Transposase DDE domain